MNITAKVCINSVDLFPVFSSFLGLEKWMDLTNCDSWILSRLRRRSARAPRVCVVSCVVYRTDESDVLLFYPNNCRLPLSSALAAKSAPPRKRAR